MRRRCAVLAGALCCALLVGVAPAQATGEGPVGPAASQPRATGLVVPADSVLPAGVLDLLGSVLGLDVVEQVDLGGSAVALRFDRSLPAAVIDLLGGVLSTVLGVDSVTPDLVATVDDATNDPYFSRQTNLWPGPAGASTANDPTPSTGPVVSINAPAMWAATTGKRSVVVAVVDTGITSHPDLKGQTVAGYDMISDPRTSNDGGGRDPDPSDRGSGSDGSRCAAYDSSWHGTHVAGIIAAKRNNTVGIAGIAPGVALQPVRVVGECGGSMSDIIAGIRWASGGHVSGVPDNTTPAEVINLSLSSPVDDGACPAPYQAVVDEARARGALVVASAGNQSASVLTRTPANCDGVVSVGATTPGGQPTTYTNAGRSIDLMAPGGLRPTEGAGIWSTLNSGKTVPKSPTYGQLAGTSMAAPAVSAAAALLLSLDGVTPDGAVEAIRSAATPPKRSEGYYTCLSTDSSGTQHNVCGAGVLDLAPVPVPVHRASLSGDARPGSTLQVVGGRWNGEPGSVTHQWLRDGVPVDGATGETFGVTEADRGRTLTVRSTSHTEGYPDFSGLSVARGVPRAGVTVGLRLSSRTARVKRSRLYAAVSVAVEQGRSPAGSVQVWVDGVRVSTVAVGPAGTVRVRLPTFRKTGRHVVRARFAGTRAVSSGWSVTRSVTVRK